MSGYVGMIVVGAGLVALALLRGIYGRPSAKKPWYEELATYVALLLFVVPFSLTVARSPEGIARFQTDINRTIPYSSKQAPLSRENIVQQLSTTPVDKKTPRVNCSTCHAPKRELIPQLTARVSADASTLDNEFRNITKPMKQRLQDNREVVRHLPQVDPKQGFFLKLVGWFTPGGREKKRLQQQAQDKLSESARITARLDQVDSYYHIEQFRKLENEYAGRPKSISTPSSVHQLLIAADNNTSFYKALLKGNDEKVKATWSIRILEWGMPFFVIVVLVGRVILRRGCPEADWYILPGMVLFTGISLQLMSDLSLNYLPRLRFIAFYHWRNTLGALLMLLVITLLAGVPVTRKVLSRLLEVTRTKSIKTTLLFCLLALTAAAAGYFLAGDRYKVAELLKMLLVGFLAWYAMARGDYLSRATDINGLQGYEWVVNNLLEFLLLSLSVMIAFAAIHDFGPLLVTMLFLCVYIWLLLGTGRLVTVLSVWGGMAALALLLRDLITRMGSFAYLFRRLDEMLKPFTMGTGEIAKLHWLRSSAGLFGHDFGDLPYYGHYIHGIDSITVVAPAQIQSDYTASHIVAAWGYLPGLLLLGIYMVWILAAFISGARTASSQNASQLARFSGWLIALTAVMLTIQALFTLAGNFAIAPLSGLTLPMISYGSFNMVFCVLVVSILYAKEKLS